VEDHQQEEVKPLMPVKEEKVDYPRGVMRSMVEVVEVVMELHQEHLEQRLEDHHCMEQVVVDKVDLRLPQTLEVTVVREDNQDLIHQGVVDNPELILTHQQVDRQEVTEMEITVGTEVVAEALQQVRMEMVVPVDRVVLLEVEEEVEELVEQQVQITVVMEEEVVEVRLEYILGKQIKNKQNGNYIFLDY
jgi:hypothetical protein